MRLTKTLAATAAAALILAGCGAGGRDNGGTDAGGDEPSAAEIVDGDTTGVTDTSIKLGTHQPLTGVAAPGYSEINTGMTAYFNFVNANGGVNGREIELIVKDDVYNPTNTTRVVEELVMQDEVFAILGGLGTPTHTAVIDYLTEEGVPDLFVSSGSSTWSEDPETHPNMYGWQIDYISEGKIMGQWIAENYPDAKVGLYLQDDDLGEDGEEGLRQFIDDQIVEVVKYTPGNTDVAPQITRLQASGADFVVGFNVPAYTALSQLVAMRLNYQPQWMYSKIGADINTVGGLLQQFSEGAVGEAGALEDVYTFQYMYGLDSGDSPWVDLWTRVWEEHGTGQPATDYRGYGMAVAYTFVQALEALGDNVTREGIIQVVQEQGSTWEGPNLTPYHYSPESHFGMSGGRVTQFKSGKAEPVGEIMVTTPDDGEVRLDDSGFADNVPPESGIPGQ